MSSADRPGNKDLHSLDLPDEEEFHDPTPILEMEDWPAPCSRREQQSPPINLYLALHCPRCGQLANLDPKCRLQPCLLDHGPTHSFLLNGHHHEFEQ